MDDTLRALNDISLTTYLVGGGFFFLFIAIVGEVRWRGKIIFDAGPVGRAIALILGLPSVVAGAGIEMAIQVAGLEDFDDVVVASAEFDEYYPGDASEPNAFLSGRSSAEGVEYGVEMGYGSGEMVAVPVIMGCETPGFFDGKWRTTWGELSFIPDLSDEVLIAEYGTDNGMIYLVPGEACGEYEGVWIEDSSNVDCEESVLDEDPRTFWGGIYVQFVTNPPAFQAYWDYCADQDMLSEDVWAGRRE